MLEIQQGKEEDEEGDSTTQHKVDTKVIGSQIKGRQPRTSPHLPSSLVSFAVLD